MKEEAQLTICITGGHLTPAIAIIEEIQRQKKGWKIIFLGRRKAFEGAGGLAHEERLVNALGVSFYGLTTGRFRRFISLGSLFSLLKVPIGFFQALFLFLINRPALVLSFGGYVALPAVLSAVLLRIPVMTHEQTETLGLANKIIARFARRVILARESGVPLRHALFDPSARPSFSIDDTPLLYITGGSTGAQSLNDLVFPIIRQLVERYSVVHQVGDHSVEKAREVYEALAPMVRHRYHFASYVDVTDVAWIYSHAALVIGRAGANTVAEVATLGKPALFVPLPWSADGEQSKNGNWLVKAGSAIVANQYELTPSSLAQRIEEMMGNITRYQEAAKHIAVICPRDGATRVVEEIATIVRVI